MARGYIPVDRGQQFLLAPDMREWLPENHLVWFLLEVVERLDTGVLHRRRRRGGVGRAGYDPDMLLALLVYAYCTKVRSSRQIERLCETDVAYKVICAGRTPDHTTVARFRQEHAAIAAQLFVDVLEICAQAGLAQVGVVALDGTKIGANASKAANRSRDSLETEIASMFDEAAAADEDEDERFGGRRGDELPAELADPSRRAERLKAALEVLDRRGQSSRAGRRQVWAGHIERAEANLAAARQRWEESHVNPPPRGRPKYPQGCRIAAMEARLERLKARHAAIQTGMRGREPKVNLTDPDSRLMTTPKGWLQAYNAQAAINEIGIFTAAEVFAENDDKGLFLPMLDALAAASVTTGPVGVVLADAGYCSQANLTAPGPTRLIATRGARKVRADTTITKGPPPPDAHPLDAMAHSLRTAEGRRLYKQRSWTVEPGFGNIKTNLGFTRFSRRGLPAVQAEWKLITTAANLLKLHRWHPLAIKTLPAG